MTRHFIAAALAVIVLATPALAFAQATNTASSSYSDTKPKKVAAHKTHAPKKAKSSKKAAK